VVGSCRFASVWGVWTVEWTDSSTGPRVRRLALPDPRSTEVDATPPGPIGVLVDRIRRHLAGDLQDFRDVAVDLSGSTPFTIEVCRWIRSIPAGETRTYGQVAAALGKPMASRAVGGALSRNPVGLVVPCHRVVGVGGLTGFSAPGGIATKERLLRLERSW